MRIVHWFGLVSAGLFLCGIGLVVGGARETRRAPAAVDAPARPLTPVATVKQIMNGIVSPAATVVFDAVITTISDKGITEVAPQTDEEWEAVGNSAAALAESGNLMLMGSRKVDSGDWVTMSQAMIESSMVVLRAVEAKSADGIFAAGEALNASCDNCHRKYQRGS